MAPVVVQRGQTFDGGAASVTVTLGADPTPGNMLIAVFKDNTNTSILTKPTGWSWVGNTPWNAGTLHQVAIAYKVAEAADTTGVTFGSDSAVASKALAVVEVEDVEGPFTAIQTTTSASSTSKQFVSTGTLAQTSNYVLAVCDQGVNNGGEVSVSDGFTLRHAAFATYLMVADIITTADTELSPLFTWTTARISFGLTVVFPEKATPPTPTTDLRVYDGSVWVDHTLELLV